MSERDTDPLPFDMFVVERAAPFCWSVWFVGSSEDRLHVADFTTQAKAERIADIGRLIYAAGLNAVGRNG